MNNKCKQWTLISEKKLFVLKDTAKGKFIVKCFCNKTQLVQYWDPFNEIIQQIQTFGI